MDKVPSLTEPSSKSRTSDQAQTRSESKSSWDVSPLSETSSQPWQDLCRTIQTWLFNPIACSASKYIPAMTHMLHCTARGRRWPDYYTKICFLDCRMLVVKKICNSFNSLSILNLVISYVSLNLASDITDNEILP